MKRTVIASLFAALPIATALSLPAYATSMYPDRPPPGVTVFNQEAKETVRVSFAYLPKGGFALVYKLNKSGKPEGHPIGVAALGQGTHEHFKIPLSQSVSKGERLGVTLAIDENGDKKFEAHQDKLYWKGFPREHTFTITG